MDSTRALNEDEASDDHADERESDDAGHDLSTQKVMPVDLFEHFCLHFDISHADSLTDLIRLI